MLSCRRLKKQAMGVRSSGAHCTWRSPLTVTNYLRHTKAVPTPLASLLLPEIQAYAPAQAVVTSEHRATTAAIKPRPSRAVNKLGRYCSVGQGQAFRGSPTNPLPRRGTYAAAVKMGPRSDLFDSDEARAKPNPLDLLLNVLQLSVGHLAVNVPLRGEVSGQSTKVGGRGNSVGAAIFLHPFRA